MKIHTSAAFLLAAALLSGCVTKGGGAVRIDNIAMYGQPEIVRPEALKKADEWFIAEAVSGLGSREAASKAWYDEGQRFLREGNYDFAMRRFNQSWLLDPNSYWPYWGFGQVMVQKGKFDDGIRYLQKSESLIDDPYQKVALLSDLGSAYSYKARQMPEFYAEANKKFAESTALDPTYANAWRRWAFSLYNQGEYEAAWEKVRVAQSIMPDAFSATFLSKLRDKAPEPNVTDHPAIRSKSI